MQNGIFAERLNDSRRELIHVRTALSGAMPGHRTPHHSDKCSVCLLRRRHRRQHGNPPPAVRDGYRLHVAIRLLDDECNQPQAHRLLVDPDIVLSTSPRPSPATASLPCTWVRYAHSPRSPRWRNRITCGSRVDLRLGHFSEIHATYAALPVIAKQPRRDLLGLHSTLANPPNPDRPRSLSPNDSSRTHRL